MVLCLTPDNELFFSAVFMDTSILRRKFTTTSADVSLVHQALAPFVALALFGMHLSEA